MRSALFGYGVFPLHNPWVCGGLDILANPQNRLFSPFLAYDLIFPPQWSNLISLCTYSIIGFFGFVRLAEQLGVARQSAFVGAWLFLHSSWFGLHFAEGHIPFGAMQALPLILSLALKLNDMKSFTVLVLCHVLMVLDGAIYAAIFSLFCIASLAIVGYLPLRSCFHLAKKRGLLILSILLATTGLALPKILPVLYSISDRPPNLDYFEMPWDLVTRAFLDPRITLFEYAHHLNGQLFWRLHEFGCYLSWLALAIIFISVLKFRGLLRQCTPLIGVALFWFWVGSGLFPNFNPWKFFAGLPLVNNAHVQSRVFLIVFLFFSIITTLSIDRFVSNKFVFWTVALLLLGESFWVRNCPMFNAPPAYERLPGYELIQRTRIEETKGGVQWTPRHYLANENIGSASCYEPSFLPVNILASDNPQYRGEIFLSDMNAGKVEMLSYTPGRINLRYSFKRPTTIILNSNALFGWVADSSKMAVEGRGTDLLRITPALLEGEAALNYSPPYIPGIIFAFCAGTLVLALCWLRIGRL